MIIETRSFQVPLLQNVKDLFKKKIFKTGILRSTRKLTSSTLGALEAERTAVLGTEHEVIFKLVFEPKHLVENLL